MVLDEICDVFGIFHDGTAYYFSGDDKHLVLRVHCRYLAKMLQPSFENFYVHLFDLSEFVFVPHEHVSDKTKSVFFTSEAFKYSIEILYSKQINCHVEVDCNLRPMPDNCMYPSGNLLVNAGDVKVYDHNGKQLSIESLAAISEKYWKRVHDETEKRLLGP